MFISPKILMKYEKGSNNALTIITCISLTKLCITSIQLFISI